MLRASFSEVIGGRPIAFALPLSGLQKIAAVEDKLFRLNDRLSSRDARLSDVLLVLEAATGPDEARHVIESLRFLGALERAQKILLLAITEPVGEDGDAAEPGKPAASSAAPDSTPDSTGAPT